MTRRYHVIVAAILLLAWTAPAQRPSFEVSSVRVNASGEGGATIGPLGARFVARNVTVKQLITYAYATRDAQILDEQLIGGPSWAGVDRFDIQAKPEGDARVVAGEQTKAMARALLEDRFQLKVHREKRSMAVYNLVATKRGPKSSKDQTPPDPRQTFVTFTPLGQGSDPLPRGAMRVSTGPGITTLTGTGISIPRMIMLLQGKADRIVIDRTNFDGLVDVHLEFGHEFDYGTKEAVTTSDQSVPSLFTAIQEIGLKLEPGKAPLEVLVIDSVQRPSEN